MKTVTEKCALTVNYEKRTLPLQHSRMPEATRRLQSVARFPVVHCGMRHDGDACWYGCI